MNKKVFVLGGSGILGTSILHFLSKHDFEIYSGDIKQANVPFGKHIYANILNKNEIPSIIYNMDIIINCTGQITQPIKGCIEQNSKGICNLINVLKENTNIHLVQISTINVLGTILNEADENSAINPETPYSTAKAFAEVLITENIPSNKRTILRLSNLYGQSQNKGIINYLISSFNTGTNLVFNNNGDLNRFFIHVDDASRIITQFLKVGPFHGLYHLVGNDKYTVKELISVCEKISGKTLDVNYENKIPWENINCFSESKLKKILDINYMYNINKYLQLYLK